MNRGRNLSSPGCAPSTHPDRPVGLGSFTVRGAVDPGELVFRPRGI